ncbi:MAG: hypothetical protein ACI4E1_13710 [Lachnospira sp.]
MNKIKSMIKITDRDKMLIVIVLAACIVALAYFFGFQKINDANSKLETKQTQLTKTQKDLKEKNVNKDKYIKETASYNMQYESIIRSYSAGSTQPSTIDFLNKVESITGVWVRSVAFSDPTAVYTFGRNASNNPNASSGGETYSSDYVGYRTSLNIAYEAEYDKWKDFIDYVNNYSSKNTIETISMAYNDATDTVTGTVTISMYSIYGSDRPFTENKFTTPTGSDNIFSE